MLGNAEGAARREFLVSLAAAGASVVATRRGVAATMSPPGKTGVVNVRDLGATGDGTTDDTAALQAAADAAAGGLLWFPDGKYLLRRSLNIRSNTRVTGAGRAVLVQGADDINMMVVSDAVNVEVEGLMFDGGGRGSSPSTSLNIAFFSKDTSALAKNLRVRNCQFEAPFRQAIQIQGPGGGHYSSNVVLEGNYCRGSGDEALSLYFIRHGEMSRNVIEDHTSEALKIADCDHFLVADNQVAGRFTDLPHGPLIDVGHSSSGVVRGNVLTGGVEGITLEKGVQGVSVIGNFCEGQGDQGITASVTKGDAEPLSQVVIANNIVRDSGISNILVAGQAAPVARSIAIIGNACEGMRASPGGNNITISVVDDVTVIGNICSGSSKHGIAVGHAARCVLANNMIDSPALAGISLGSAGTATVAGNSVWRANRHNGSYAGIEVDAESGYVSLQGNQCHDDTGQMRVGVSNLARHASEGGDQ